MSNPPVSTAPSSPLNWSAFATRMAIVSGVIVVFMFILLGPGGVGWMGRQLATARMHAPDWGLIAAAPLAIRVHLSTVLAALVLATFQVVGPKGRTAHRLIGWVLAVLLVTTAIASLFIPGPRGGLFNPFQLFSIWTLVAMPLGILAARAHNVRRHGYMMMGFYFGGLILAGVLTFMPGRLMWRVFFG
jgi:uncharacterized membrane protein